MASSEDASAEYSIALEYDGPPVSDHIPTVMPIAISPKKIIRWSSRIVFDQREEIVELGISPEASPLGQPSSSSSSSSPSGGASAAVGDRRRRGPGSCSVCGKGNRFTGKEACIVCGTTYCARCVLKAMGSMPEGRKCLTCVGRPIDESRRRMLGRSPRVLQRVLSSVEVEQIMRTERNSEANRVRPEVVIVNGEPLSEKEMALLEGCGNPPGKLRPGRYWYDRASGLWGVEGHKPYKIVAPDLDIGGCLQETASNGDTEVLINGRRITKSERVLLKFAGVQYAGNSQLWLHADGSYQEEGQVNTRGNLWSKPGTRMACFVLSLPFPCEGMTALSEANNSVCNTLSNPVENKNVQELLLIGSFGSGAHILFNQAKLLYKHVPFTEEECEKFKVIIQLNTYRYLGALLEGREQFEEEYLAGDKSRNQSRQTIYSISPRLKEFSDWLLGIIYSGTLDIIFPASTREYAPLITNLWKTSAIQATYNRRSELTNLPSVASYFLEKVEDILTPEYEVSHQDILNSDGVVPSNGLAYTEFIFPYTREDDEDDSVRASNHKAIPRYELVLVRTRNLCDNKKWLDMFKDSRIVIFCVALSDYDENCEDADGNLINKMLANKKLFENITTHPNFDQMNLLLVLNKFDLFEQKIEHAPLNLCEWFSDFIPMKNKSKDSNKITSTAERASHYIAFKFKTLFASLTGKRLYAILVDDFDKNSVDVMFRYAREILRWEGEKASFNFEEASTDSTDTTSSTSH